MLWNLDTSWLMMAVAIVALLSYLLALALHAIMGSDGFGPLGNTLIVTTGFFLGILAVNYYGVTLRDLTMAAAAGLSGSFLSLGVLALLKAGLERMLASG